jgi:hypothetical protein
MFKGLGPNCPYYLDPSKNEMTGRRIEDPSVIENNLTLHNEVRSKIAKGRCQQPKAGCMRPLVRKIPFYHFVNIVDRFTYNQFIMKCF